MCYSEKAHCKCTPSIHNKCAARLGTLSQRSAGRSSDRVLREMFTWECTPTLSLIAPTTVCMRCPDCFRANIPSKIHMNGLCAWTHRLFTTLRLAASPCFQLSSSISDWTPMNCMDKGDIQVGREFFRCSTSFRDYSDIAVGKPTVTIQRRQREEERKREK